MCSVAMETGGFLLSIKTGNKGKQKEKENKRISQNVVVICTYIYSDSEI